MPEKSKDMKNIIISIAMLVISAAVLTWLGIQLWSAECFERSFNGELTAEVLETEEPAENTFELTEPENTAEVPEETNSADSEDYVEVKSFGMGDE